MLKAIYLFSRLMDLIGVLAYLGAVAIGGLILGDQINIAGAWLLCPLLLIVGIVTRWISSQLDHCLRHTPWIEISRMKLVA